MAVVWTDPKTNWKNTDRFNVSDFNRIKNNIEFLHNEAELLYKNFEISNMGQNIESYESYWDVKCFNAFEENIETINNIIFTQDYGIMQRFFENGPFIKWDELNRIETACLRMKDILHRQKIGLRKIPFSLGNMKGVRS